MIYYSNNLVGSSVVLEEATDGSVVKEKEYTVFAQLLDFSQLSQASRVIKQEQWGVHIPKGEQNAVEGNIRVRKVEEEGKEPEYHLTTKVKMGEGDKLECTVLTTEANFTQFAFLANDGMIKERYEFPIEGTELKWEIDVYRKPDGTNHSWCRLDLEVPSFDTKLPELPIEFGEVILPEGYGDMDKEERSERVAKLYAEVFRAPNKYLKRGEQNVAEQAPVQE